MARGNFPQWNNKLSWDGVAEIVVSWILSPVASGICAAFLYGLCKVFILNHNTSYLRAKIAFPIIVGFTTGMNAAYWIVKGTKGQPERFGTARLVREAKSGNLWPTIEVGLYIGVACGGFTALLLPKLVKNYRPTIHGNEHNDDEIMEKIEDIEQDTLDFDASIQDNSSVFSYIKKQINRNIHEDVHTNEIVGNIHKNMIVHDPKVEHFFSYVQVFTAIVDSFSHGANDVANAMGPFAAAYIAYKKGKVINKYELNENTMMWILALGGAGMTLGLATYGYKIINAMGVN